MREVMEQYARLGGLIASAEVDSRETNHKFNEVIEDNMNLKSELRAMKVRVDHLETLRSEQDNYAAELLAQRNAIQEKWEQAQRERDQVQADLDGSVEAAMETTQQLQDEVATMENRAISAEHRNLQLMSLMDRLKEHLDKANERLKKAGAPQVRW